MLSLSENTKNKKMPKAAKSHYEWEVRILEFVAGKPFGQGQRPGKATKWGKVVEKIEKCPMKTIKSKKERCIRKAACM